jgi:hypothetical protein
MLIITCDYKVLRKINMKLKFRNEIWDGGTHLILILQLSHYVLHMAIYISFCAKHV